MTICPQCQREIPEINQGKFCPFCGAVLGNEEASTAAPSAEAGTGLSTSFSPVQEEAAAGAGAQSGYVPWEDRERVGFLQSFSQTWSDATFRPTQFFRGAPKTGNLGAALLFAFLVGMVAALISSFWQYQLWDSFSELSEMPELRGFERFWATAWSRETLRYVVLTSPLWVLLSIVLRAGILHIGLLLTGGNRHGWDASLRASCYSTGPQLFAIVPWCGDVISFVWQLVLVVIGARELHETSNSRAAWAVILPFLLCCCSLTFLAYRLAAWLSRFSTQI